MSTPKTASPVPKTAKPANKRANTMEASAAAGKKFVERKKRGEPTHKMGRRSTQPALDNDRELKKIVESATTDGKKRRLTALERTALEGANYVSHKKAKATH